MRHQRTAPRSPAKVTTCRALGVKQAYQRVFRFFAMAPAIQAVREDSQTGKVGLCVSSKRDLPALLSVRLQYVQAPSCTQISSEDRDEEPPAQEEERSRDTMSVSFADCEPSFRTVNDTHDPSALVMKLCT